MMHLVNVSGFIYNLDNITCAIPHPNNEELEVRFVDGTTQYVHLKYPEKPHSEQEAQRFYTYLQSACEHTFNAETDAELSGEQNPKFNMGEHVIYRDDLEGNIELIVDRVEFQQGKWIYTLVDANGCAWAIGAAEDDMAPVPSQPEAGKPVRVSTEIHLARGAKEVWDLLMVGDRIHWRNPTGDKPAENTATIKALYEDDTWVLTASGDGEERQVRTSAIYKVEREEVVY